MIFGRKKSIPAFAFCLLLLLAGFAGCEQRAHSEEAAHPTGTYPITQPLQKDTTLTRDYVAQLFSHRHIEVRAIEEGYLQEIFVDEGQLVRKGQLMCQILPVLHDAEVRKIQAEVKMAEIEYRNTQILADSGVVSPNELAMAKAKYEKAQAELAIAQVHLNFTQIRAPFEGIMDKLEVRLGSLISEGELITKLSDNQKMWVYFSVPETEYLDFMEQKLSKQERQVQLRLANGKLFDQPGVVETIEADFNNETGNIAFRATFPNPNGLLRHGSTGSVLMQKKLQNALLIPQRCTFEILDKKFVFVVDAQGVVHQREIAVTAELEDLFVVGKGLKADEKILLEGIRMVQDKQKIQFAYKSPEEVYSSMKLYAE